MKRDSASSSSRSRPRKKTAAAAPAPAPVSEAAPVPLAKRPRAAAPAETRNVSSLEGGLSVAAGVLFVVSAVFPRSLKQLFYLGIGAALLHRGMTGKCNVYVALDIDTAKEGLLKQVTEKLTAPAA